MAEPLASSSEKIIHSSIYYSMLLVIKRKTIKLPLYRGNGTHINVYQRVQHCLKLNSFRMFMCRTEAEGPVHNFKPYQQSKTVWTH